MRHPGISNSGKQLLLLKEGQIQAEGNGRLNIGHCLIGAAIMEGNKHIENAAKHGREWGKTALNFPLAL